MRSQRKSDYTDSKTEIRKRMRALRNKMTEEEVQSFSEVICERIESLDVYREAEVILSYYPTQNEVSVLSLMDDAINKNKAVYLPRVQNRDMIFFRYQSVDDVTQGYMGIYEPVTTEMFEKTEENRQTVIMLMPGTAFDQNRNRLGYGGGFYDRYLSGYEVYKIGVCYDFQITEEAIPTEPFDIRPDMIVTDKRILD